MNPDLNIRENFCYQVVDAVEVQVKERDTRFVLLKDLLTDPDTEETEDRSPVRGRCLMSPDLLEILEWESEIYSDSPDKSELFWVSLGDLRKNFAKVEACLYNREYSCHSSYELEN
jgi:hypothetical protein